MHAAMMLGRQKPTAAHLKRAMPLQRYMRAPLPSAPASFQGSRGAAIGMWGNDRYGCCTFAAAANFRAIDAALRGRPAPPTTEQAVIDAYLAFTGGQDEGAVEIEVLEAAKEHGLQLGGDPWQLALWASVELADVATCKSLVAIFGALYLGVELPIAAQSQAVWDVDAQSSPDAVPGSWGGHALLWSDFDTSTNGLVTWGGVKTATPAWLGAYGDEAHVLLDAADAAAIGVDFEALAADIQAVALP